MLKFSFLRLTAIILSSSGISAKIRRQIALETAKLSYRTKVAVLLVGSRFDSLSYIRAKKKTAEQCGIILEVKNLPESISQSTLQEELSLLSNDPNVDGVLLQLPIPNYFNVASSLLHIAPNKDVDGLHIINSANLFLREKNSFATRLLSQISQQTTDRQMLEDAIVMNTSNISETAPRCESLESTYFVPCTALSVRSILFSYLCETLNMSTSVFSSVICNLHVVIVNRSMVVGIPIAALLQKEGFIVTICGRNNSLDALRMIMRTGDIVVSAYGSPEIFNADFFKKGAIIIDAGINEVSVEKSYNEDQSLQRRKICGDVHVPSVLKVASAISVTPGGVGPLTVAYLMQNVLKASRMQRGNKASAETLYPPHLRMNQTSDSFFEDNSLRQIRQSRIKTNLTKINVDNDNFDV